MTAPSYRGVRIVHIAPKTWFGRLLVMLGAVALALLAVFFFTLFLAAFFTLSVIVIARILWAQRRSRRRGPESVINAEYTVEKTEAEMQRTATKKPLSSPEDRE